MYVTREDAAWLLRTLNADNEIAFLVADGPGRWKARRTVDELPAGQTTALWHVPSGPLPLIDRHGRAEDRWEERSTPSGPVPTPKPSGPLPLVGPTYPNIPDPFAGWRERFAGMDPTVPYFEDHTGVVRLTYRPDGWSHGSACGLSSFQWIGNRYAVIGKPAVETTERWWSELCRKVKAVATLVPWRTLSASSPPEIYAFSAALELMRDDKTFDQN